MTQEQVAAEITKYGGIVKTEGDGPIRNWRDLTRQRGWQLRSDCDSEVLLRMIEDAPTPAEGIGAAMDSAEGSAALALLDTREGGSIYLVRNGGSPLWVLRLRNDRRLFFASTRHMLTSAFQRLWGDDWQRIDLLSPLAVGITYIAPARGGLIAM